MNKTAIIVAAYSSLSIGVLILLFVSFFDTAPAGTHNIGLMQEQMLWSNFSGAMLIAGTLLLVGHYVGTKLDAIGQKLEGHSS